MSNWYELSTYIYFRNQAREAAASKHFHKEIYAAETYNTLIYNALRTIEALISPNRKPSSLPEGTTLDVVELLKFAKETAIEYLEITQQSGIILSTTSMGLDELKNNVQNMLHSINTHLAYTKDKKRLSNYIERRQKLLEEMQQHNGSGNLVQNGLFSRYASPIALQKRLSAARALYDVMSNEQPSSSLEGHHEALQHGRLKFIYQSFQRELSNLAEPQGTVYSMQ